MECSTKHQHGTRGSGGLGDTQATQELEEMEVTLGGSLNARGRKRPARDPPQSSTGRRKKARGEGPSTLAEECKAGSRGITRPLKEEVDRPLTEEALKKEEETGEKEEEEQQQQHQKEVVEEEEEEGKEEEKEQGAGRPPFVSALLPDIDSGNLNNYKHCAEYMVGVHLNYMELEEMLLEMVEEAMERHPHEAQLTARQRLGVINWLLQVHHNYKARPETLFLAVEYFDHFMASEEIAEKDLKLAVATCLRLAVKFQEKQGFPIEEMKYGFTARQVFLMEVRILSAIEGWFMRPTTTIFLRRHARAVGYHDRAEQLTYCEYLSEISLYANELITVRPSLVAAAIIMIARISFRENDIYPEALANHSGHKYEDAIPVAEQLLETLGNVQDFREVTRRPHGPAMVTPYVVTKFGKDKRFFASVRNVPSID